MITQTSLPAIQLGSGILLQSITGSGLLTADSSVLIVVDAYWVDQPIFESLRSTVKNHARDIAVFDAFSGEPKDTHIDAAVELGSAIDAKLVIGLGGGSALDIAKMAALCLTGEHGALHYALNANPVPDQICDLIQIPTTAGTGSEANGTAIFSSAEQGKLWVYGTALKPRLAILDADLLQSLPRALKAWCAMDALIHAFEAGTNQWANRVNTANAVRALDLILSALPKALQGDAGAHEDLLLGSFLAGHAIENTGTSIAHCASHALARFAPIHHGLATAIAFEQTLDRVVASENPSLSVVAPSFGVVPALLPQFITAFMDELGIERSLPPSFKQVSSSELALEMQAPANAPMRDAALIDTSPTSLAEMADAILNRAA